MIDAIACVLPMNDKWYIGKDNDLLFRIPNDLEFFKNAQSEYHTLICGFNTYMTLPSYIKNRDDVTLAVLTKKRIVARNVKVISTDDLKDYSKGIMDRALVIGGGKTYRAALPYISNFFVTIIKEQTKYTEEDLLGSVHIPDLTPFHNWCLGYTFYGFEYSQEKVQEYLFAQFHNIHGDEIGHFITAEMQNESMKNFFEKGRKNNE